jgi:hypothetical protein
MSPAKKPITEEEKQLRVRQEGRRGHLRIAKAMIDDIGLDKLEDILMRVGFQTTGKFVEPDCIKYYGYCPLFAPLDFHEKSLNYLMRVDLREAEPIVEFFIVNKEEA